MGTFGIYGWDCVRNSRGNINKKATLDKEFNVGDHKVLMSTTKGQHWYGVCQAADGQVYGLACIMSIREDTLYYKPISESAGPRLTAMPEKYLDWLDTHAPLNDKNDPCGYARAWRAECRANNERKRQERAARNARRKRLRELGIIH